MQFLKKHEIPNLKYFKMEYFFSIFKDSGIFVLLTFNNPLNRPPNNLKI